MIETRINTKWSSFVSNVKDINKIIENVSIQHLKEVGKHVKTKMKKNLNKKGRSSPGNYPGKLTGHLQKHIDSKLLDVKRDPYVMVGSYSPHAHLLEFGHGDGKEMNKRPFIFRTLDEETEEIKRILSEDYF